MDDDSVKKVIRLSKLILFLLLSGLVYLVIELSKLIFNLLLHCLAFITCYTHEYLYRSFCTMCNELRFTLKEFREMLCGIEEKDKYIDSLLHGTVGDYGPYKTDDTTIRIPNMKLFEDPSIGVLDGVVSGTVMFDNGYIVGLQRLHRRYSSCLSRENGRLHVKADLRGGPFRFMYTGKTEFRNITRPINILGTLRYANVSMEFSVNLDTGEDKRLHRFCVSYMKDVKFTINDLGSLKRAEDIIAGRFAKKIEKTIKEAFELYVAMRICEFFPYYQFPIRSVVIPAIDGN